MGFPSPKKKPPSFTTDQPGDGIPWFPATDRSGSGLGALHKNPGVTTGAHFGHHKNASPAPAHQAGMAQNFNQPPNMGMGAGMADGLTTYFPPIETFQSNTMDIYASQGNPPPPAGQPRTSRVNILIAGVFPEGTRSRGQGTFDYTHIILVDTNIEVHDGYTGSSSVVGNGGDVLKIPSGVANYWQAVFVFVTQIPGVGRKKVVLADRRGAVGDFTKIV